MAGIPTIDEQPQPAPANPAKPRLVVYVGEARLVVDKFNDASEALIVVVTEHGGYVAGSNTSTVANAAQEGRWDVKIPVSKFEDFRKALKKLGELVQFSLKSDDISDRYYDQETRVKNLLKEEAATREMFDHVKGNFDEIVKIKQRLLDLRNQIEVAEGQLKRWGAQAAEASLTIHLVDRGTYVPVEPPTFNSEVGKTFAGSLRTP